MRCLLLHILYNLHTEIHKDDAQYILIFSVRMKLLKIQIADLRARLVPPEFKFWHYAKRRFPVTSNLRYIYGVLNVDEIKN